MALCDEMKKLGWSLAKVNYPAGCHMAFTSANYQDWKKFIVDFKNTFEKMRGDPKLNTNDEVAVYGISDMLPDKSQIEKFLGHYLENYLD